jgi:hypothetical protein
MNLNPDADTSGKGSRLLFFAGPASSGGVNFAARAGVIRNVRRIRNKKCPVETGHLKL